MSPLLALPREIRDEIFSYLALPQHTYTSSPRPDTHSLHRARKDPETYIDTRIYLPACPPINVLATCRQLREECLENHAHLLNGQVSTTILDPMPQEETKSYQLAKRAGTGLDEQAERTRDDGSARITLEILRGTRGLMGYYVPTRDEFSPRFLALRLFLCRVKRIKIVVWAGFDWWNGPRRHPIRVDRIQRARFKRTSWDQDDEAQPPSQARENNSATAPLPTPLPNPLSVAIDSLLEHLPLVEELKVDILMHAADYYNWDLPDNKCERIRGWLEGPICSEPGKNLRKVHRRLIAGHWEISRSATFYHQLETRKGGEEIFYVQEGSGDVPSDDWDGVPGEPALKVSYDRSVGESRDPPTGTHNNPDRESQDA